MLNTNSNTTVTIEENKYQVSNKISHSNILNSLKLKTNTSARLKQKGVES